jgi:hypothetical protein
MRLNRLLPAKNKINYLDGMTDRQKLAQAADVLRLQSAKIRELKAEVARLNAVIEGSCDALMHLQRLYGDPRNPPSITMKAACAAVAYGRSKPSPVAGASLYDMLEERKRLEQRKRVIDAKPDPAA